MGGDFLRDAYLFKVNLGGMIDLLSNHLYSSPAVYLRELLQNGMDAISARTAAAPAFSAGELHITLDEGKVIRFRDNGVGLSEDELHRFLAVIGQSSKHDLESGRASGDYIGRFGIGLLSCFLIADEIVIHTRSAKPDSPSLVWRGKPDGTYTIAPLPEGCPVGTEVFLTAKTGCEEYCTAQKVTQLVRYYGLPLPVPVYLGDTRLNPKFDAGGSRRDVLALGSTLFGTDFLDFIPLQSPTGLFSGVAFVLPYTVAPTAQSNHRIYLKSMLLTENGSRLLPKWAFFVQCFLNTDALRPTASREEFYEDETLLKAREELAACISDYLRDLAAHRPAMLRKLTAVHSLAVKSIAIEDDSLFDTFIPYLCFETTAGELSGQALLDQKGEVVYTTQVEMFRQLSAIYRAQNALLVNGGYVYEQPLLEKLAQTHPAFALSPLRLQSVSELLGDVPLDRRHETLSLLRTAEAVLAPYDCLPEVKRFAPAQLPALYLLDEEARILRDIRRSQETADPLFSGLLDTFAAEQADRAAARLYLNENCPLIKRLLTLDDDERLRCCISVLYVQALLAGSFPMRNGELQVLNENLLTLLGWGLEE